jgi:hypothetical protein
MIFLEELPVAQEIQKTLACTEFEGLLPCSQQSANGPKPQPYKSNPQPPTLFP